MNIVILGAGGVGSYFGAKLVQAGHDVLFVARGEHLNAMQKSGLHVKHPSLSFSQKINACDMQALLKHNPSSFDVILLLTKSMDTQEIGNTLVQWFEENASVPYVLSLQNGVENEAILAHFLPKDRIIGGLTRKIGAHVIRAGSVEAVGVAETIIGLIAESIEGNAFIQQLAHVFNDVGIPTDITDDIAKELWKKLIINNGVNALCALLRVKTGELFEHTNLASLVKNLMQETATAARLLHVKISQDDVEAMFELISHFDSIKPSMLVDLEHGRVLELDEICGVVIRTLEKKGVDAPHTKTIVSLLEYKLGVK